MPTGRTQGWPCTTDTQRWTLHRLRERERTRVITRDRRLQNYTHSVYVHYLRIIHIGMQYYTYILYTLYRHDTHRNAALHPYCIHYTHILHIQNMDISVCFMPTVYICMNSICFIESPPEHPPSSQYRSPEETVVFQCSGIIIRTTPLAC